MKVNVEVVKAKPEHCELLAETMDDAGKELIRAGWGVEALEGLERACAACPSHLLWTILLGGKVVGMFGCADSETEPEVGYPWLTTAPGIEKIKLRFIRRSRGYVEKMFARHDVLMSYAHRDNKPLLGWLRWCGFRVEETEGEFFKCVLERQAFRPRSNAEGP